MNDTVLSLQAIRRSFTQGDSRLDVLKGCSLSLARGEKIALVGPSGAGKSTLLHIAGLLEEPDDGTIAIAGQNASTANDALRTMLRRAHIGFVYQFHHLLPEFSARENIMLPQMIAGATAAQAAQRADQLLEMIDLSNRATHRPARLSGGEQQRVAIARAVAKRPELLLCDEPTGALDYSTGKLVLEVIEKVNRELGTTTLVITHNVSISGMADRVITLRSGEVVEDRRNEKKISPSELSW